MRQLSLELERRGIDEITIEGVAVLVDRGNNANERASEFGVPLHSLAVLRDRQIYALKGVASDREVEIVSQYVSDPIPFQDESVRKGLTEEAMR